MIPAADVRALARGPQSPDWDDPLFRALAVHDVMTAEAPCALDTSLYPSEMRECRRLSWVEFWPPFRFAAEGAPRSEQEAVSADLVPGASRFTCAVCAVVYGRPGAVGQAEALVERPPPARIPRDIPCIAADTLRKAMLLCSVGAGGAAIPVLERMFREMRGVVDAACIPHQSPSLSPEAIDVQSVVRDVLNSHLLT
jgi:hypothetical protein